MSLNPRSATKPGVAPWSRYRRRHRASRPRRTRLVLEDGGGAVAQLEGVLDLLIFCAARLREPREEDLGQAQTRARRAGRAFGKMKIP